jgi:5-methylcytosine-specific restriction endonuclease McrA
VWCSQECIDAYNLVWSWGAVRDYVIRRDKGTCGLCGTTDPEILEGMKGIRFDPWDVDHIVPVADGGTDDPANLRLLCMACHVKVGHEQRAARNPEVDDAQHVLDLEHTL